MVAGRTLTQGTGDFLGATKPEYGYRKASEASHHLRACFRSGLMTILIEGHISDVMRAVLYIPMPSVKFQETFCICLL